MLDPITFHAKRSRHVHSGVRCVELDASACVKDVAPVVQRGKRASQWRVLCISEQPDEGLAQGKQLAVFNAVLRGSSAEPVYFGSAMR